MTQNSTTNHLTVKDRNLIDPAMFYDKMPNSNHMIYLVDDDYDDRLFSYCALRRSDRVSEVRTVKCANTLFKCFENLGLYDSNSFADYHMPIILLDIHMPGINGIETLERIRNHPVTSTFPVILLTSDTSTEQVYEAYRLHANGFLQKPFDLKDFHDIIDTLDSDFWKLKFGENSNII